MRRTCSLPRSLPALLLLLPLLGACSLELGTDTEITEESISELDWIPADAPIRQGYFWDGIAEKTRLFHYAEVDGLAIAEGDIVLGRVDGEHRMGEGEVDKSIARTGAAYRWPNALVPYTIDSDLPKQSRITNAIALWQQSTNIRFVQRTSSNASSYPDYVRFVRGTGCYSYVGRINGEQVINLQDECSQGATIHEIGHAIGLWHEHNREDRDSYVRINFENTQSGTEHHFYQNITNGDDILPYDYSSIMHYGPYAFSRNGQPTIEALGGQSIGQRNGLSNTDAAGSVRIYARPVSLQSAGGHYMVAEGGGGQAVLANRTSVNSWETFYLVDTNAGSLESGDTVWLQVNNGMYMVAEGGGGGVVNANRTAAGGWETFRIWKVGGSGTIGSGSSVALQASNGMFMVAEGGGGGAVNANRTAINSWETFTIRMY